MTTPATVIEFQQVSKRFLLHHDRRNSFQERVAGLLRPRPPGEEFWALRDISFSIAKGESLGLVGHNGAGKSTALKLMTRILEPTSGRVRLRGRVAALLELGSGFHPDLSGRENVFLNGSLMGFSRREMRARLDEIVDFAEIEDFIDLEVKHYSSGMYTRLAFAVATTVDPDILLTDEVLAVGDEAFQRKCLERIYRFRRLGKTIVFVSHALDTVRQLCDRAVWLDRGAMRAVGPAREVIDAYLEETNVRETAARLRAAGDGQDVPDAEERWRHGTREVEIRAVELLDGTGGRQELFYTGESLTVRLHYDAHIHIDRPQFGLGIYDTSGVMVSGPNNNFAGYPIAGIDGCGAVDYTIERLPLLSGQYWLTVAVHDSSGAITYDHHERHYGFMVRSHALQSSYGLVEIPACWRHSPKDEG